MSADNGIYILEMKDQSRVIHTQNIENLWWSNLARRQITNFVPTRIVEYYGNEESLTVEEAHIKACETYDEIMEDDFCPIVEYGIQLFRINKTWEKIVEEAKELALKEIKKLQKDNENNFWDYDIEALQRIIAM